MTNLKSFFITSGITFVFGFYSIYNLYIYLKHIEYNKKIYFLKKTVDNIETNNKKLEKNIALLMNKVLELENMHTENVVTKNVVTDNLQYNYNIIDPLLEPEENIYLNNVEIIELIHKDNFLDYDCIEDIHINYDSDDLDELDELNNVNKTGNNISESIVNNNLVLETELETVRNRSRSRSRSRSTSVTDVNWTSLTKKFIFG